MTARISAALRLVDAFRRSWVARQLGGRPHRARGESTTAIGAAPLQLLLDAAHAEGALERADACIGRVRRQVRIAALAVGAELEHEF